MKLMIGLLSVMLLGSFSHGTSVTFEDDTEAKTAEIANILIDNDVTIKSWSLHTKGKMGFKSISSGKRLTTSELQADSPEYNWIEKVDGDGIVKFIGTKLDSKLGIKDTVTLITYPENDRNSSYLIYNMEVSGFHQEEWRTAYEHFTSQKSQFFHEDAPVFTCFKGVKDDKMNIVLYKEADKLLNDFEASKVEEVNEETFVSLSAYHKKWKETITTNNQRMNLQIALRDTGMGGATTVTIGTPIITTEY
ncbi:YwmB family TATA-box binding protein [Alkalihalobacillus sp. CinArs1]|uniref:YwmB family TATA-box binding protein n=1 Tax=Alkalihalobacillus sp. CinArs1 TaxID=2995314 RepID=UPI0022DDA4DF|nr:YwmB family TATA-box binding protein [Alkalihalobacillus sp. CinArs1]